MKTIVLRKEAKAFGLKRYYTGKACKHGHVDERRVHDGACCECQRINYRIYLSDNIEKERKRKAAWMNSWRDDMDEAIKAVFSKKHYEKYVHGYKARARGRLETCRVATPPWVDTKAISEIYRKCPPGHHVDHIMPLRGITPEGWKVFGLHVPWNLQYLTAEENRTKRNKVQLHDLNEVM